MNDISEEQIIEGIENLIEIIKNSFIKGEIIIYNPKNYKLALERNIRFISKRKKEE